MQNKKTQQKLKAHKLKYMTDPTYRQTRIDKAKAYYAKNKKRLLDDPRIDLVEQLDLNGSNRIDIKTNRTLLTFNATEFGNLVNWTASNVYRKWNEGLLPKPVITAKDPESTKKIEHQKVYNKTQAKKLVDILGKHFITQGYYRPTHVETKAKLFSVIK